MRHMNDTEWTKFCGTQLKRFESKWTRKLEDYKNGKHKDDENDEEDEAWKEEDAQDDSDDGKKTKARKSRYE